MKPSTVNVANDVEVTEARPTHVSSHHRTLMMPSVTWVALLTLSPQLNARTDVLVGFLYLRLESKYFSPCLTYLK